MLPDVPSSSNFQIPLYEFLKKYALSIEQHIELKEYCDSIGIIYLCTPFSYKAAFELNRANIVDAFKIGSGEMTDIPSLIKIAQFGKPLIISTGMCTFEEIDRTYYALKDTGVTFSLMSCVSEYPPIYEDISLGVIKKMKDRYPDIVIGHSDHTPDLFTSFAAVALGARIIEKHVIIDKRVAGPDQSVSIDFNELYELCDGVKKISLASGEEKSVKEKEKAIRLWAFRSVVSVKDIPKGAIISQEMVWSKRPGTGIPSYRMNEIVGKKATRDIKVNTLISFDDIEN